MFWLLLLVSGLVWYLWRSPWIAAGYATGTIVLIGIHYGFKTWAIVTLYRRPRWFAFNTTIVILSKLTIFMGTLGLLGVGVWLRWFVQSPTP